MTPAFTLRDFRDSNRWLKFSRLPSGDFRLSWTPGFLPDPLGSSIELDCCALAKLLEATAVSEGDLATTMIMDTSIEPLAPGLCFRIRAGIHVFALHWKKDFTGVQPEPAIQSLFFHRESLLELERFLGQENREQEEPGHNCLCPAFGL